MKALLFAFFISFHCTGCFWSLSQDKVITVGSLDLNASEYSQRLIEKVSEYDPIQVKDPQKIKQIKTLLTAEIIEELLIQATFQKKGHSRQGPRTEQALLFLKNRQLLWNSLKENIDVTEEMIGGYYLQNAGSFVENSVHVRQIFVKTREEAERLVSLLKTKKFSFSDVAKKYSQSAEAKKSGDLGWVPKGTSPVLDAAFKLPVGVSYTIFESPQGYHLFEVIEVKKTAVPPLKEVREKIIRAMKEQGLNSIYQQWLEEQTRLLKVKINTDLIDALNPVYQESVP